MKNPFKGVILIKKMSSQSETVGRNKYEALKSKALRWKDLALEREETVQKLETLSDKFRKEVTTLNTVLETERARSKIAPDDSKKIRDLEDKHSREMFELEKKVMLKEGEVERLRISLEDFKERLKDSRDDNRRLRQEFYISTERGSDRRSDRNSTKRHPNAQEEYGE